jgi:DNA-binding NarL/FixJ family response regulator
VYGVSPYTPETASAIEGSGVGILILDSVTARLSEYSLISEVLSLNPSIKVVLIDMDADPELFLECVQAGASGYILKDASAAEVVSGVQAVAKGDAVCPPGLCIHLFRAFSRQCAASPASRTKFEVGLTRRQQQIVPLISQGLTNKEIGSHLKISEGTVKNHIHGIMLRTGANHRLQVADWNRFSSADQ